MSDPAEQFISAFSDQADVRRQWIFVLKGDKKVQLKSIEAVTCEDCLHNAPSWNGWCALHNKNTFKVELTSCCRCNNTEKLEFKNACADYKTTAAATDTE
jgi:hypothetical protein